MERTGNTLLVGSRLDQMEPFTVLRLAVVSRSARAMEEVAALFSAFKGRSGGLRATSTDDVGFAVITTGPQRAAKPLTLNDLRCNHL